MADILERPKWRAGEVWMRGTRAAVIELAPEEPPRLEWVDPRPHSVMFLPRIGQKSYGTLAGMGITRPEQLFAAPDSVFDKIRFGPTTRARLRAIESNSPIWLSRPQLPEQMLFYDVETGLQLPGDGLDPAPHPISG